MKKILILICAFLMFTSSAVFAYEYSEYEKTQFYNGFVQGFFGELPKSLVASGHSREKAYKYTAALKARLNRQQLEQETWGCISQNNVAQMLTQQNELAAKCFGPWVTKFMNNNSDLYQLLK